MLHILANLIRRHVFFLPALSSLWRGRKTVQTGNVVAQLGVHAVKQ